MSAPPRYWTPAFIERFVDRMNHDPDFQKEIQGFEGAIELRCLDTPDGKDVSATYTFDEGFVSVKVDEDAAPSARLREQPFDRKRLFARATAPYAVWKKLDTGEMTAVGALASPDYRIEGSKMKIMLNMNVFNAMSALAAGIEKTY
ncbi:MAG: hypothetical protein KatS3mg044_0034 [Rhodothermaceae bacterium]|nr:MAG: hypothetical protein KatS3mg044_0034 [Rhodothermaceae bacterium]